MCETWSKKCSYALAIETEVLGVGLCHHELYATFVREVAYRKRVLLQYSSVSSGVQEGKRVACLQLSSLYFVQDARRVPLVGRIDNWDGILLVTEVGDLAPLLFRGVNP